MKIPPRFPSSRFLSSRFLFLLPALAFCAFSMGSLAGCEGTATGTDNTVAEERTLSGTVVSEKGDRLAGARVLLKQAGYVPPEIPVASASASGSPPLSSDPGKSASTDSLGRFSFKVKADSVYFLEIRAEGEGPGIRLFWKDSLRVEKAKDSVLLAPARVLNPGSLEGRIRLSRPGRPIGPLSPPATTWVGVTGTASFVRVTEGGAFRLDSLAEGTHRLTVLVLPVLQPGETRPAPASVFFLEGRRIESGRAAILDTVITLTDRMAGCAENLREIAFDSAFSGESSAPGRKLRTVALGLTPFLAEIDLCAGRYRPVTPLSGAAGGARGAPSDGGALPGVPAAGLPVLDGTASLLALPEADFVYRPGDSLVYRLGLNGLSALALPGRLLQAAASADSGALRLYARWADDPRIAVYGSEADFRARKPAGYRIAPSDTLPFAALGGTLFFLARETRPGPGGAGPAPIVYGLRILAAGSEVLGPFIPLDLGPAVSGAGPARPVGLVPLADGTVYVMGEFGELHHLRRDDGRRLRSLPLRGPYKMAGLAGFR